LPSGICVPASCEDGNACTTDRCQSGTCVHTREGFTAVECEIGTLLENHSCGSDPVDPKLAGAIVGKSTKARDLVHKASAGGKSQQKLLKRAAKVLAGLRRRIGKTFKKAKITDACRGTLDALVLERERFVEQLLGP
jgi:hypothetical protein